MCVCVSLDYQEFIYGIRVISAYTIADSYFSLQVIRN